MIRTYRATAISQGTQRWTLSSLLWRAQRQCFNQLQSRRRLGCSVWLSHLPFVVSPLQQLIPSVTATPGQNAEQRQVETQPVGMCRDECGVRGNTTDDSQLQLQSMCRCESNIRAPLSTASLLLSCLHHCVYPAAIHDMNRKQQPQQEQYCEVDWNNISTIDTEAYWVSKVRRKGGLTG